jgi:hypothetical protein
MPPALEFAPSFAQIDGAIVGYVTQTAHADGRWLAQVLPNGPGTAGLHCYAGNEARAKRFVERWLKHHAPDTTTWVGRKPFPHEGNVLPPRKPKGSDDRS